MRVVRVHEAAAQEAIEAAAWYERERPGLGTEFEQAIQAALDLLENEIAPDAPLPGMAGARGARRLILKRFPYDVVVVKREGEMLVVAFAHQARRPGYWHNRLSGPRS